MHENSAVNVDDPQAFTHRFAEVNGIRTMGWYMMKGR